MKRIRIVLLGFLAFTAGNHAAAQNLPLTFPDYLSRVAAHNLEYIAEQYNVKIADAEVAAQRVFPDPVLSFEGADEEFSLELEYTLELGKRRARIGVAKAELAVETLALQWFFQELRAEATEGYLEALHQRNLLELRKEVYDYMAQLARYDSIRYRTGEIPQTDARQSALEAATLLNEVYQQEGEYLASLAQMYSFTGALPSLFTDPIGRLEDNLNRDYELGFITSLGLENRLDLAAAARNIDLNNQLLQLTRAERRPDVDVMIGYGREWRGFLPRRNMLYAGVSVPLSFSALNKGTVRQAKYAVEQSRTLERQTELEVRTQIAQAFFLYEALENQIERFRSGILDDAQKVLDGVTFSYKRGETDISDVLIAQRTYSEVREEYLEKLRDYASALVELQKSCGIWDIEL